MRKLKEGSTLYTLKEYLDAVEWRAGDLHNSALVMLEDFPDRTDFVKTLKQMQRTYVGLGVDLEEMSDLLKEVPGEYTE